MAVDWAENVRKYTENPDELAIAGIIAHCGIALRSRDGAQVAFSDKAETDLVREHFCKKKLDLTLTDATLNKAIADIGKRMTPNNDHNRVTVYYLLAEKYRKLEMFHKKSAKAATKPATKRGTAKVAAGAAALGAAGAASVAAAAEAPATAPKAAATKAAKTTTAAAGAVGGAALVVGGAALGAAGTLAGPAADTAKAAASGTVDAAKGAVGAVGGVAAGAGAALSGAGDLAGAGAAKLSSVAASVHGPDIHAPARGKWGGLLWLLAGLALLALILWLLHSCSASAPTANTAAAVPTNAPPPATAPGAPIPAGAGVTTGTRNGKPLLTVYFASDSAAVPTTFAAATVDLKAYAAAHADAKFGVSGFADKTGNATYNAELSKHRAAAVKAALVSSGFADGAVALVKPADDIDTSANTAGARRVEITPQ